MTDDVARRTVLRAAGALGCAAGAVAVASEATAATHEKPVRAADVPVAGGRVYPEEDLVVTQPTAGDFRGFSATCTHSGCKVAEVRDGSIHCYCHGSRFRIADGSVEQGPALLPLPAEPITVEKGTIRRRS